MKSLETQIEELETMRTRWLLVILLGFIFWDGFRIIDGHLVEGGIANSLQIIIWTGWLIWVIGLVQLTRVGLKVKKTKMASQILNDELVELTRLKSWRFALIAVVSTQVVIICAPLFSIEISGILSAELSIFVAVVSALSAFTYYENELANA